MAQAPRIDSLDPSAALPGAEVRVLGSDLSANARLPAVRVAGMAAAVVISSANLLVARVPEAAVTGLVEVEVSGRPPVPSPAALEVGAQIAENLHPVCSPALDAEGNIFVTLSGTRGQKTPVSLFRLDANFTLKPFSSALTNPSGLAFDREGTLFASSRFDGSVYRVAANGAATLVAQGLGVATGIAFDPAGDLHVGDRSGTIFKIDRLGKTFVFATLEPSVAAYHLAFGPDRHLYVAGPSASSRDSIWCINPHGAVTPFFEGLGRPQGLAFDIAGNLYVAASYRGRRGIIRIDPNRQAACVVSGMNLVGLAFAPGSPGGPSSSALILATHTSLYHLPWAVAGALLPPRAD
ncbi:MAG: IPT/TIG domain-containing protein [Terriglobales bacterium]